ncbi:MAG: magnesium chelatase [Gemmatimonadota bacterium]|nr:magnesium chelatase [Gemmatimonadota bacterium]MDH3367390.1 magnesium chelatase [Gemmatimonadota bacterium]MDH3478364.1 magnesium chelatase [Gemmatimonadota bacterium]MDH5549703.1 magnesium chelatase [Gemmatimonadota bacterium]
MTKPSTLADLIQTEWADPRVHGRSVKDEMRQNLVRMLDADQELFPGIVGFEDSVVPQAVNAVLARHNFILLGLRGQAKSRILRQLVDLLDEEIPIIAGSEVNDNPFGPISKFGRQLLDERGDRTPIEWIPRHRRYVEKLATPDVTIADIIGDVDPIKAARGGHLLSDELTIHYGLLPRSNRGIFAINELPDLAGKIQVGLFNIMQEGDVQIKGYPIRLPLDVLLVFSANPEDYTARGKIITPLKDRIGSEILTHYPVTIDHGMEITEQEAWVARDGIPVEVPDFIRELVERIAFEARDDKRIDRRSGVSQRLPIAVLENVVSSAEQRAIMKKEARIVPRIADLYRALPAITGKIELEYEGELQGAEIIARDLVRRAAGKTFENRCGGLDCDSIVEWFDQGGALKLSQHEAAKLCLKGFATVPGLLDAVDLVGLAPGKEPGSVVAACELILEGLVAHKRISRSDELGYVRSRMRGPGGPGGPGGQQIFG